ncbi:MAG TPA: putative quinol monooxygenase [Caulobacteraceae bacterium]|jgi:quinol monooxygenase YgiN|nr:putative quinol monooxygenase [Caulobacteraceae bacterium]
MSLIIAGTVRVPPDKADALTPHAMTMMRATLQEDGCVHYVFSRDFEDRGLIHLFEEWRDEGALAAHFATPHMKTWREALAGLGPIERDLVTYNIASQAPRP